MGVDIKPLVAAARSQTSPCKKTMKNAVDPQVSTQRGSNAAIETEAL